MRKLLTSIAFLPLLCMSSAAFAEPDYIQCVEDDKRIICSLTIPEFIKKASSILTNGWENTFQIHIELLNGNGKKVLQRTKLEATQRCYLDPFESPCLILWRGAKTWQRYEDEESFLMAMSKFGIQALTLEDLPADNYIILFSLQIMASAQKRVESIRSWFKQSTGTSKSFSFGNGSLISAFIGSRAENVDGNTSLSIELKTSPFFIDLSHTEHQKNYNDESIDNIETDEEIEDLGEEQTQTDMPDETPDDPNQLNMTHIEDTTLSGEKNDPPSPDKDEPDMSLVDVSPVVQNEMMTTDDESTKHAIRE